MKTGPSLFVAIVAVLLGGCAASADPGSASAEEGVSYAPRPAPAKSDGNEKSVTREPNRTPDVRAAQTAGASLATFDEIAPILMNRCGHCHRPTMFATIDRVKTLRDAIVDRLSSGTMPQDEPTWVTTADGHRVLAYLKDSPELD